MLDANFHDDRGNALLEFILGGLLLQVLLLTLITSLSAEVDSQVAANLIARQALRSHQLGSSKYALQTEVANIANVFNLHSGDFAVSTSGSCPNTVSIHVRVDHASANARAKCH